MTNSTWVQRVRGGFSAIVAVLAFALAGPGVLAQTDPNQGPGGPILVVTSSTATFGRFYAEVLRTEGFNEFAVADLAAVNATVLNSYDVVILAEAALTSGQVSMFTTWVTNGGNLIAMRPSSNLASLLGVTFTGATLANGYLLIDQGATAPGKGLVAETIQYLGTADRYTLNGATEVARLYSSPTAVTTNALITVRNVGAAGGTAVAFGYDLARSLVYARQGNPAWNQIERDGFAPIRPNDLFFGASVVDPQPDWVNLDKAEIPQADEQQRLLGKVIAAVNADKGPLPRFWYFPHGEKAVVVMTGDDHAAGGTAGRFNQYIAASPPGCSVADWQCIRSTSYIYPDTPLSDSEAASYTAQGFEVGLHVSTGCANFTPPSLASIYTTQVNSFRAKYTSVPTLYTQRHHCIVWSDWSTGAKQQRLHGMRLDTSYYYWPASWIQNRPGFMTGSGMPMRFADLDGTLLDVYQAVTHMTDESGQQYPFTVNALLDAALGPQEAFGAFTANLHTDIAASAASDAVVASAITRGVPVISARQLLTWTDARNDSSFSGLTWSGGNLLSFTVNRAAQATGLRGYVPYQMSAGTVSQVRRGGTPISFSIESIKGEYYVFFDAQAGAYQVTYAADTAAPTVLSSAPAPGATNVSRLTPIAALFSEPIQPATVSTATVELRDPGNVLVPMTVSYDALSRQVTATVGGVLAANSTYTLTLRGGATGIKDVSGNSLVANYVSTFTTGTGPSCPCNVWPDTSVPSNPSSEDTASVEVGVKFTVDLDGQISGVRFYKGSGNTGTHVGNLWTADGQRLATAVFAGETATGWQTVNFPTSVSVTAGTVYIASYFAPNGHFAEDRQFFATSGVDGLVNLLQDGLSGGNGIYSYATSSIFPSSTFQATNYWVDVLYTPSISGIDVVPPSITTRVPAEGATGVAVATTVIATFSEPLNPSTVTGSTVHLRNAGGTLIPASVTYDTATRRAILTPTSLLTASTTYNATVVGGAGGIRDLVGNAMPGDVVWTFTTAAPDVLAPTITQVSPPNGSLNLSTAVAATARFSEAMLPSSISGATFELRGTAGLVGATVTYDAATFTARLTPTNLLAPFAAYTATVKGGATGVRDASGNALAADYSWSFTTGADVHSMWTDSVVPPDPSSPDTQAVALGVKFTADRDGEIRGIRFYKSDGNIGTHVGRLWTSSGQLLATATFTNETATGWQRVDFAAPVTVTAGNVYVASYHAPNGRYVRTLNYFTTATVEQGPLNFLRDGLSGGNGVYTYGAATVFPASSWIGSNYWVDVVFAAAPDLTPPTITGSTPPNGSSVSTAARVSATFSEALDPNSVNGLAFELRNGVGALVAATVAYDTATSTATLTPTAMLSPLTSYVARINGGASGVRDVAGNPLAQDSTWSFTTASGATMWDASAVPAVTSNADTGAVALGVKFTTDINGYITGIRFYKGTGNTGTHVGKLWTSTGQLLATATFTSETASGWQQADFSSAVAVTAGTVYVASYHAPVGGYALSANYFASSGVESGPLNFLRDGVSGGNGVFAYGSASVFPNGTWNASNYWVDVVFSQTNADVTAPIVTQVSPQNGGANVGLGTSVTATFSEALNPSSVTAANFELRNGSTLVPASISYSSATATLTPSAPLAALTTYTARIKGGASGVRDVAGNALAQDFTWSFTTSNGTTISSMWDPSVVPAIPSNSDPDPVALGVKFTTDLNGYITGIRFYKGAGNTGTHTGKLWTSTGQLLATATFTNETATGWQQVDFASAVAVTAGTVYVASYYAPVGRYAWTVGYFANNGVESGPLNFLADGVSGGNGVFGYGPATVFPNGSWNATNYWVDVVFAETNVDTTPPTVTQVSPASGGTGVSIATTVAATFSEALNPATVTVANVELRNSGGTLVPAGLAYSANTATLTPSAALAAGATYTARVRGGSTGVKDLAGHALAVDFTWSFTTASAGSGGATTMWDPSVVPGVPSNSDPDAVALGVKFTTDINGYIAGIRFYKGAANTGTHTAKLWTSTGQQLGSAVFTNETASGWQQANFASPIAVTAGTVYVASYHAPVGRYAATTSYFADTGYESGPLNFLRDGVSGGNGVFAYGSAAVFPNGSWNASNYWVDVVFQTTSADITPPTVTGVTPPNGGSEISIAASVTATFSEPMNASTVTAANFELRNGGGTLVPATISYSAGAATLTPTALLAVGTTYNVRVRGGGSGVKDVAGLPLAVDFTSSFTTEATASPCSVAVNKIVAENCLTGNPPSEWEISEVGDPSIQGFATEMSVNVGQTINFKIKTNAAAYQIEIFRLGYYGGLGARKVATVLPSATLPQNQPNCVSEPTTGLIDCGNWGTSASWAVPATATSGVYIAVLKRTDTGGASHIVFVVREDSSTSHMIFQTSDTTWQAYNDYGGNSLYVGAPAGRAYKVSYNRPFSTRMHNYGEDWLFNGEYAMIRFLERNGYDVSYWSGIDTDRFGATRLANHRVFLSVGHDEYWSGPQRANVEAARNNGVDLAFFSGNEIFWRTRWESSIAGTTQSYRTLVSYKETHANAIIDPQSPPGWTGTWRDPRFSPPAAGNNPENALTGQWFRVNSGTTAIQVPAADGKMRLWRNTSVATQSTGQVATLAAGTLGYEWDEDPDNGFRPPGLVRLSTTDAPNVFLLEDWGSNYGWGPARHHLTMYKHNSGALVFGAGTIQWAWGLDGYHDLNFGQAPDSRMQQATVNLFADMGVQPATLQTGLVAAQASTDTTAPTTAFTSPASGASIPRNVQSTIGGTAADTGGGVVGAVEVSVDGGVTWHPASGRSPWTYTWTPTQAGSVTLRARSADDSGNLQASPTTRTITVQ